MRKAMLAIAVLVALAACGSAHNVASTPTTTASTIHTTSTATTTTQAKSAAKNFGMSFHGYPPSLVNKFMSSCRKRSSRLGCDCVLAYMSANHPYQQIKAASLKKVYDWELTAARACAQL